MDAAIYSISKSSGQSGPNRVSYPSIVCKTLLFEQNSRPAASKRPHCPLLSGTRALPDGGPASQETQFAPLNNYGPCNCQAAAHTPSPDALYSDRPQFPPAGTFGPPVRRHGKSFTKICRCIKSVVQLTDRRRVEWLYHGFGVKGCCMFRKSRKTDSSLQTSPVIRWYPSSRSCTNNPQRKVKHRQMPPLMVRKADWRR